MFIPDLSCSANGPRVKKAPSRVFGSATKNLSIFNPNSGKYNPVPEIIDPVFAKTSPIPSFSMTENERFGLVFANTGSINSGTGCLFPISDQDFFHPGSRTKGVKTPDPRSISATLYVKQNLPGPNILYVAFTRIRV